MRARRDRPWFRLLPMLGLATLLLITSGCDYFSRAAECRKLAKAVNPVLAWVDTARQKTPEQAPTFRDIAARYDGLATTLGDRFERHSPLGDLAAEYQSLFRESAQQARVFAEALDSGDPRRMASARQLATRTTKRESQLLLRVGPTCSRR